MQNINFSNNNN